MYCTKCGSELSQNNRCSKCGVENKKGLFHKIPGFRSGRMWRKTLSIIVHLILVIFVVLGLSVGTEYCTTQKDSIFNILNNIVFLMIVVITPYIALTDIFRLYRKVDFFKDKPIIFRLVFLPVIVFVTFMASALFVLPMIEKQFSDGYIEASKIVVTTVQEEKVLEQVNKEQTITKEEPIEKLELIPTIETTLPKVEVEKSEEESKKTFNKKQFESDLKKLLKEEKFTEVVTLINDTLPDSKNIAIKQVDQSIVNLLKKNKKAVFEQVDMEIIKTLHSKLEPLNGLSNSSEYKAIDIINNLSIIISCETVIEALIIEIGDFNLNGTPIDLEKLVELNVYILRRIKDVSEWKNDLNDLVGKRDDNFYATSYETLWGTVVPNSNWECVVIPTETNFTEAGVYKILAVESGTMTLIDSMGFEREVDKYREVTQEQIERAQIFESMKEKQDRIVDYKNKIKDTLDLSKSLLEKEM